MMLVVKDLRVRQVVSCQLHSENPRKLPNLAKNELLSKMNLLVSSFAVSYTLDTQWVALHLGASLDFGKIIIVLCCTACILNTTLYICVLMFTSQCCPITGKLFFAYIVSHIQFQTVIFFFTCSSDMICPVWPFWNHCKQRFIKAGSGLSQTVFLS